MTSCQYKILTDFLIKHNAKNNNDTCQPTHTRIGDKSLNIYGGSYIIPKEELEQFYRLYYEYIIIKNNVEYLTEKQLENNGPLLIDLDFRYNYSIDTRQHTKEHIIDIIDAYLQELKEFFVFKENVVFPIYVMEKPNINRLADKSLTKDGIHILIGLQMDHVMQLMLREKMIKKLQEICDLPLINSWDSVLDEGISKGSTNWQLFLSRKPGNQAYELTGYYNIKYDSRDGEFMLEECRVVDFDLSKNLYKLSAQYDNNIKFDINPKILDEYNNLCNSKSKIKKPKNKTKLRLLQIDDEDDETEITLEEITNHEILKLAIERKFSKLNTLEYPIKEIHDYTQTLPEKYYEPGSHVLNIQVAYALKYMDDYTCLPKSCSGSRLFLSWIMLRSKGSDFDFETIPALYKKWKKLNNKEEGVTGRSIMYWSKQDNLSEYIKVKHNTIEHYIKTTLPSATEYDIAMVLYILKKDQYICSSYKHNIWYIFKDHKWEIDQDGFSLRRSISEDLYSIYHAKMNILMSEMKHYENSDISKYEESKKDLVAIGQICVKLKRTSDKNNIMREAREIFYDKYFNDNADSNKYLLCFTNGVVDFKKKIFRDGYPHDYITNSTGIPYIPYNSLENDKVNQINNILEQIFPVPELYRYMKDHLASSLIGVNKNQTFNIYRGSGSNGKSIIATLMTKALGDYSQIVPATLVTEKRSKIGGVSPEVIMLKGVRYAVIQEISKDQQLNEGIMKELTGGDRIQARQLFQETETFVPQFKLCVCTNTLFEINSNDDGTWRRIRICDFMSKFVDNIVEGDDAPPYQFLKDKSLEEKCVTLAPTFASILVERAFETDGDVVDCDIVLASSKKYRNGQDHIAAFVSEMVIKTGKPTDKIKKRELTDEFKIWFQELQGSRKMPKGVELQEYMDKKYGKCKNNYWGGVLINYQTNEEDLEEL